VRSPGLTPASTLTWVPDTCCNDSNGSSNSRNTNTLLERSSTLPDNEPEIDNLVGTHFVFCYPERARTQPQPHSHPRPPPKTRESLSLTRSKERTRLSPIPTTTGSLCRFVTSTPVEIRRASRVIVKSPRMAGGSRCPCRSNYNPPPHPHDKLMEDSYGILICEGEGGVSRESSSRQQPPLPKKLRVLCAKCLQNHDPLLTDCLELQDEEEEDRVPPIPSFVTLPLPSETTDYPSGTEMTCDDELSVTSTATYSTWPRKGQFLPPPMLTMSSTMTGAQRGGFPREFTSREYVRTWLLTSQARHELYSEVERRRRNGGNKLKRINRSTTVVTRGVPLPLHKSRNKSSQSNIRNTIPQQSLQRRGPSDGESQSQSPDEGLSLHPPPRQKMHPLLHYGCKISESPSYENGLSLETLQMFYKDLEIIV
jgi:hypothetical protein